MSIDHQIILQTVVTNLVAGVISSRRIHSVSGAAHGGAPDAEQLIAMILPSSGIHRYPDLCGAIAKAEDPAMHEFWQTACINSTHGLPVGVQAA
jgi:hypothetical protein